MKKHVHLAKRPGAGAHFLPVEGEIVRSDLLGSPYQQGAGTAGRIAYTAARFGGNETGEGFGDLCRGVKLSGYWEKFLV